MLEDDWGEWLKNQNLKRDDYNMLDKEDIGQIEALIEEINARRPESINANVRYEQIEKQFDQMREETDKRFEQVEKQLAQNREAINKRFEHMDEKLVFSCKNKRLYFNA